MKIAAITPTRGDRKQFFDFARVQLDSQTVQPDARYYMAYTPENGAADLIQRVRKGIELARRDGMDAVFVIEDDDCYPSNYIEEMKRHFLFADFVGYDDTTYYNIRNKTWMSQSHPGRSSLFCTGFMLHAINDFVWPADHFLWLDVRLWEFARDAKKKVRLLANNPCVGIKHGVGLCGGKAHRWDMVNKDPDMSFLKSRVEDYQFEFYSKLKL